VVALLTVGLFVAGIPATYAHYQTVCDGPGCGDLWQLVPEDVRALDVLGLSVAFYATYNVSIEILFALGYWAVAVLVFWKRSDDPVAWFVSLMLVSVGAIGVANHTLYALEDELWLPVRCVESLALVSFFVSFYLFPDGRFVPRWTLVLVALLTAYQSLFSLLDLVPVGLYGVLVLGQLGTLVFACAYRYTRVSGPVERQQTKWVLFGLTAAIAVFVATVVVGLSHAAFTQPGVPGMLFTLASRTVWSLSFLLIPLSIAIAILRYRLWDIDVIISRTLVYGCLTTVLATVFAITDTLLLPLLVQSLLGAENASVTAVVSAVIIAAMFKPMRSRIEAGVDKLSDRLAKRDETGDSLR